jgi:hypothetical protein
LRLTPETHQSPAYVIAEIDWTWQPTMFWSRRSCEPLMGPHPDRWTLQENVSLRSVVKRYQAKLAVETIGKCFWIMVPTSITKRSSGAGQILTCDAANATLPRWSGQDTITRSGLSLCDYHTRNGVEFLDSTLCAEFFERTLPASNGQERRDLDPIWHTCVPYARERPCPNASKARVAKEQRTRSRPLPSPNVLTSHQEGSLPPCVER